MLIDDEEHLLEATQDMLERLGYTVTAHNRNTEALNVYMSDPSLFDMVITDQIMPDMTGADLAKRMLLIRPDIPIILCTGHSTVVNEELAKAIGRASCKKRERASYMLPSKAMKITY